MMAGVRIAVIVLLLSLAAAADFGCSRALGGRSPRVDSAISPRVSPMDAAIADIDSYNLPAGVDRHLFEMLARKLVLELAANEEGRSLSQAKIASPPLQLLVEDKGEGTAEFSWRYHLPGDYNLDGEVSVADITPIALNYLESVTDGNRDNVQRFIDGDLSGEIGVSDVTPIALNYQAKYEIYAGIYTSAPAANASLEEWESGSLSGTYASMIQPQSGWQEVNVNREASDTGYGRASIAFDIDAAGLSTGEYYFAVRDAAQPPRFASSDVFSLSGRDLPKIASVSPRGGLPGSQVQFYADLESGTGPFSYFWGFGGGAVPNTSMDELPLVALTTETGVYPAFVVVSNAFGSDTYQWELRVGEAPSIISISPKSGKPGSTAAFEAEVTGEAPFLFDWRFGTLSEPQQSGEPSPAVTLTTVKGEYEASLTVSNEYGSDSIEFSVFIGDPPEIESVAPDIGMATMPGKFAAEVSGDQPLAFHWDFGGGASPNESQDSSPVVDFGPNPGNYSASLTVSNPAGSDRYDFTLEVIPLSGDGYTLYAPLIGDKTYLVDMEGEVVHYWTSQYIPAFSCELTEGGELLRICNTEEHPFGMVNGGRLEKFDWDGNLLWSHEISTTEELIHHDVKQMPNGNVLVIVWSAYTAEEATEAGRNPANISELGMWFDSIREIQPVGANGGIVVWEWNSLDHLIQDFDPSKNNYGDPGAHPELIDINYDPNATLELTHINSVEYDEDLDQILISVHAFNEIWVIDHSTTTEEAAGHTGGRYGRGGDILYRWGNPAAYRAGSDSDRMFYYQHNANWIKEGYPGEGNILVFNNQVGITDLQNPPYSTVVEFSPPINPDGSYPLGGSRFGPSGVVWEYEAQPRESMFSLLLSSAYRLPGGNTLICCAEQAWIFEVDPSGQIVWEYFNRFPDGLPAHVFRARRYTPDYPGLERLRRQ
ncbi:MAG: aryl-sulfate sulfotransferase [bacterium]|jgi:PKD repeat protein